MMPKRLANASLAPLELEAAARVFKDALIWGILAYLKLRRSFAIPTTTPTTTPIATLIVTVITTLITTP